MAKVEVLCQSCEKIIGKGEIPNGCLDLIDVKAISYIRGTRNPNDCLPVIGSLVKHHAQRKSFLRCDLFKAIVEFTQAPVQNQVFEYNVEVHGNTTRFAPLGPIDRTESPEHLLYKLLNKNQP